MIKLRHWPEIRKEKLSVYSWSRLFFIITSISRASELKGITGRISLCGFGLLLRKIPSCCPLCPLDWKLPVPESWNQEVPPRTGLSAAAGHRHHDDTTGRRSPPWAWVVIVSVKYHFIVVDFFIHKNDRKFCPYSYFYFII